MVVVCDKLVVNFGVEIFKIVFGCVLIEVDVCFFFDKEKSIEKVCYLVDLY